MTITMTETPEQRNAERIRQCAMPVLLALMTIRNEAALAPDHLAIANEAIEYATGAHDPDCYPEEGYEVDAAGTFKG